MSVDDDLIVRIHGYAAATVYIPKDRWERMTRADRRDWARSQLSKHGESTEVTVVQAEDEEGDFTEEEEW